MLLTTVKVSECKLRPFEYTQSMSRQPAGLVYIGNTINYCSYLLAPFPRGLEVEGNSIFLLLMLLMHIDILGLVSHWYRYLFNCTTTCQGSLAGSTALCLEVGWRCTIAVSAWCSMHQLPG